MSLFHSLPTSRNIEDGYCDGTGAIIIDDASVKVTKVDTLSDTPVKMPCDQTDLGIYVAKKIMAG